MLRVVSFITLITLASSFDIKTMIERSSNVNKESSHDSIPEGKPIRIVETSPYGMSSNARRLTIDSPVDPIPASGPPHLLQLRGHCFSLKNGDYNYEFCPFFNVSQREVTSRWNSYHGLLGVWSGWIFQNNSDYIGGMRYTFGDKCGSHGYKNTSVVFECSEVNNSLHQINETATCEYSFTFLTQLVCRREWRAVFPNLEGENRDNWLNAQLEFSLGYLTDKGVQHLKHDILKKIGWINELNLTRLRNNERDKEDDKSLYDRTSFVPAYMRSQEDCSKCQKELEAAKERLKESQALLQLVNRTFQSGIKANQSNASIINSLSELLASCDTPEKKSTKQLNSDGVSLLQEANGNGTVSIDTGTKRETGEQGLFLQEMVTELYEEVREFEQLN